MNKKIVKGKSLQEVEANTKYMGCSFYLNYVDGDNLEGTEFENCSFRGGFRDWGRDEYGLWMAMTYEGVRQVLRWIKPGTFMMGSPQAEMGRTEKEVQCKVTFSEGFWLGETACTQQLWEAVMGKNPCYFKGGQRPVECVSWNECQAFMDKWNEELTGIKLSFVTDAEWEYACRAGTTTAFSFGETITRKQVNYGGKETVEVKSLPCNGWGLYEMHGNVWEWCGDRYGEYSDSKTNRSIRGGSWRDRSPWYVRSAYRNWFEPDSGYDLIGFRFCLRAGNI
ncbi:formylglycine-generating enzyme family protein [Candidatus Uabimicrobium amorphum]|uniref:Sulfatase-modifying factor enzyme-like domain-containing protein n=1 Tax=Uabimicrobium amorphum TaxID=2596890 RepID=A0A5S9IPQ0_UABAM|nr:formylglycine-generating enzyme family protein [Candidatus Uabimicrobium amorphum]BBM85614.1 hypothetical protein UABAM_03988 [Candidatus Uabimicrobium amorphum]